MARTHTVFFNEGDLVQLRAEVERLTTDWRERSVYITDKDLVSAGDMRLSNLRIAVNLLGEEAD